MNRTRLPLLLATVCSFACTTEAPDPCVFDHAEVAATFLGDAYGRGTISVVREGDRYVGRAKLSRAEGQAPGPGLVLDLSGPALCEDGIVKVELGAGRTPDGRLEVLGGEVHLVLPRAGLVDRAFGTWRAELRQEDWPAPKQMGGPWVVSTSSSAIAVR